MRLFRHALVRKPAKSIINALAQDPDHIKPDYDKTMAEYMNYLETLRRMGLDLTVCEADERFPDGNFVEDTHLVLGKHLVIELNPGAPSRADEPMSLSSYLPQNLPRYVIPKKYTIDGGDILKDGKTIYVGVSRRTQQGAIEELKKLCEPYGYTVRSIQVPQGLHLKSGMTCIDKKHFVIQACFEPVLKDLCTQDKEIKYFIVPPEESHAANVLPINGKIMIPTDCPKTKAYISKYYDANDIYEVDTQQARLVDGALTCSSLLFK